MNLFLSSALRARDKAQENYKISQYESAVAVNHAKVTARLFVARPETLLTCFGAGAWKGATSDDPPGKRRQALFAFARTAVFNFLG